MPYGEGSTLRQSAVSAERCGGPCLTTEARDINQAACLFQSSVDARRLPPRNEQRAIPAEPRGESAKADFAMSGATSVAGRA